MTVEAGLAKHRLDAEPGESTQTGLPKITGT
jgi:hypothetical protein